MEQLSLLGDDTKESEEYQAFVDKFKPKKTTDDCYTPPNIYEAVKTWAVNEYHISEDTPIIRPFYPGGDYERYSYPEGCVVIDNPPFSILSKIVRFYENRNIKYFLFAPTLTLFTTAAGIARYLVCSSDVTYENGAKVNTSFVTNMDECKVRIASDLIEAIDAAEKENLKKNKKQLPKYTFPDHVITAATLKKVATRKVPFSLYPDECTFIRKLDSMGRGRGVYGGGFLLSDRAVAERAAAERAAAERAAAERAAAERAAAFKYELSERELAMVKEMNKHERRSEEKDS